MKLDAAFSALASYSSAFTASAAVQAVTLAQSLAPEPPPDIFWPAFAGAAASGLLTLKPLADPDSTAPPRKVAFLAFITLTVGFLFSFFVSDYLNGVKIMGVAGPLNYPPAVAAFAVAFGGERILAVIWSKSPQEWWAWLTSLKPGGSK